MSIKVSAVISIGTQIFSKLMSFVLVIFLARQLSPSELGVYAIAASFAFIAVEFRNLGTNTYIIRQEDVSENQKRACLGISLTVSWALGILIILSSSSLSHFYEMSSLGSILCLLAVTFFLAPFSVVPLAFMAKRFQFGQIAIYSTCSQIVNLSVVICLVLLDYGIFSIPIGLISGELIGILLLVLFFNDNFVWKVQFKSVSDVFKTGIIVSLTNVFTRLNFLAPDFIIGKLGTASDVAYFSRAQGLIDFLKSTIMSGVNPLVTPYLSRNQSSFAQLTEAYFKSNRVQHSILIPSIAVALTVGEPLIYLLFGKQWGTAGTLVPGISIGIIFRLLVGNAFSLFVVARKEKFWLVQEALSLLITVLTLISTFKYGLEVVSYSFALSGFIALCSAFLLINVVLKISILSLVRNVLPSVFLATILGMVSFGLPMIFKFSSAIFQIIVTGGVSCLLWLFLISLMKLEIFILIQSIFKRQNF